MYPKVEFFPVDNGDMTLVTLESGKTVLIDVHIRDTSSNEESIPNVASMLRERLNRDPYKRLYVDAFLLTHPDQDHVGGLQEHFHLGKIDEWSEDDDKIVIKEMWSSPIIFRRKSKAAEKEGLVLCEDARRWWDEARRRIKAFREGAGNQDGNRILILGDDIEGKTEGLDAIRIPVGESFDTVNGDSDTTAYIELFGPLGGQDEEDDELGKNHSSVICRFHLASGAKGDACVFLTGGDAEVLVWERLWEMYQDEPESLSYNLLQTPHHCSLHSLSWDSWSELGEEAKISISARNALGQAQNDASIVASSKPISDDDSDPPCVRAKREYEDILDAVQGEFFCTMTHQGELEPGVLVFSYGDGDDNGHEQSSQGPVGPIETRLDPPTKEFDKKGGGRYA